MKPIEKTQDRLKRIDELLRGKSSLLIVMQDNPDPDAIGAAVALRKLVNTLSNVSCSIAHGGTVGRAENRALVRYLGLNLRSCSELDFGKFDLTAIVDTQPGTGNNSFPDDRVPDIVIDHHPIRRASRRARLTDIRTSYGATSTILFEYLQQAQIQPDASLSTALLYAIRSDTQDLGRQASQTDIRAIGQLYPLANKRALSEIQRGRVERQYYQLLAQALGNSMVYDHCIITSLGQTTIPDMVGEVADILLRDDAASWTLCLGLFEGRLLLSIRTSQTEIKAEQVMRSLVARRGTGGGHDSMAGGQIPLKQTSPEAVERVEIILQKKFLKLVGASIQNGRKLI